jgi:hypothetical protein
MLLALFWPWVSVYFSLLTSYAKIKHYTKEIYKSKSRNSINIDVHTVENGKINNIIPHKISIMLCIFPRDGYPRVLEFVKSSRMCQFVITDLLWS